MIFELAAEESVGVNNKDNRVFIYVSELSIGYFSLGNLTFLKLAYLPSKIRFSGKYLFYEHQISAGQLSAVSSSTETLYCLISMQWLGVVDKSPTFPCFRLQSFSEHLETNE